MSDELRYRNIIRAIAERPWAIIPSMLEAMVEVVALRAAGVELEPEEIQARIAGGPGKGSANRAGSVAILPIYGVLTPRATLFSDISGGTSVESFRNDFSEAVNDDDISGIVLDVNSPGGSTELITELAADIRAAREVKPVVAIANTQAASAAYHLASQATELFVTPSGNVGSIGVFAAHEDISKALEEAGVKTTLISAGRFKTEGNPYEPLGAEAKRAIQHRVDDHYAIFVRDVAAGRGVDESTVRSGYGEGRVLHAGDALAAGMVDGVQTFDATVGALLSSGATGRAELMAQAATPALVMPGENASFSDAVDAALRAADSVVTDSEALRVLSGTKREHLGTLRDRLEAMLAASTSSSVSDEDPSPAPAGEALALEAATVHAEASARLRLTA